MQGRGPFSHILVPTDGSESSISAGHLAIQIASTHQIPITFAYVVDSIAATQMAGATSRSIEAIYQELEDKGQRYLDYLVRLARNRGMETDQVMRRGIPHSEITDLVHDLDVDLIVIGQVGRHGLNRTMGSVAKRVIESASCPVLVVRHAPERR